MQLCKLLKLDWVKQFIEDYSNINPIKCIMPGYCTFTNVNFPPRNFPLPIPKGKNFLNVSAHLTKTKEDLINFSMTVYVP
ncbi:hypothetical protein evm_015313 [Chilo suppressalis]|nr:hypothetical protein evm_015313 [Chilo suppressalis]